MPFVKALADGERRVKDGHLVAEARAQAARENGVREISGTSIIAERPASSAARMARM
ncbi:MAG: hypothetical protein WKF30_04455 [Pyrinomonadaceae bacterium]